MTAEQYSVDPQDLFYQSIKAVFKSWAALQVYPLHFKIIYLYSN
jgi:hypothetical protein